MHASEFLFLLDERVGVWLRIRRLLGERLHFYGGYTGGYYGDYIGGFYGGYYGDITMRITHDATEDS